MVIGLASPRSGTTTLAALFRAAGLDVGHEILGADGVVSWMWAVPHRAGYPAAKHDATPRGERRFAGDVVVHLIRDPVEHIASDALTEHPSLEWRAKYVFVPDGVSNIERSVFASVGWHQVIQAQGPALTFPLGAARAAVRRVTGVTLPGPTPRHNPRQHEELTAAEIEAECSSLGVRAFRWLVARYEEALCAWASDVESEKSEAAA